MLPDALGDALGLVISDLRREWERNLELMGAEGRAIIAELKAEIAELRNQARERVDSEVVRLHAAIREPQDGHTPTPEELAPLIEQAVQRRVEAIPVPAAGEPGPPGRDGADGKDAPPVSREELVEVFAASNDLIELEVERYLSGHPPAAGQDGAPGQAGIDGKDAAPPTREELLDALDHDPTVIEAAVERWLTQNPPQAGVEGAPGPAGRDGSDGKDAAPVTREALFDALVHDPAMIEMAVERWLTAHPPQNGVEGKPGQQGEKGLDGRDGRDGLPGVSGAQGERGSDGRDGREGIDGKNGVDGLGFDDMSAEYDGERTVTLRWTRGDFVKEAVLKLPIPIDRGIWRDGIVCEAADVVGFGGSAWIAIRDTAEKPDLTAKDWRLMVKKGRDGKDGVVRNAGPAGPVKLS